MELSFDQIRELIHQALGRGYWVIDLFPDRVVYVDEEGGKTYQADYSITPAGNLILGERTEVKREIVYVALNFELPPDGKAPEWIELVPAGPSVVGRDGRTFRNDQPDAVVQAMIEDGRDIPLDWEHATELKAPNGDPAPAAAWIKALEVREGGSIWGQVAWNDKGREAVEAKEYRYISPVFIYEKASSRLKRITSAALTNQPNLHLQALNHHVHTQKKEHTMDLKELLKKLGLPETATLAEALNAIGKLQGDLQTALNHAETPSLDKFVPRADYNAALERATNSEQKLKEKESAALETAINAEVDGALKAGKITPATKDYYVAMCRQDGGLDQFKKFIEAAPVIGDPSKLDGKQPPAPGVALNAEEKKLAEMFGNSEEDIKKYGQA